VYVRLVTQRVAGEQALTWQGKSPDLARLPEPQVPPVA